MNQYQVIQISFNELPKDCQSYQAYIDRIEQGGDVSIVSDKILTICEVLQVSSYGLLSGTETKGNDVRIYAVTEAYIPVFILTLPLFS